MLHGIPMLQLPNFSFFLDTSHFGDSKLNGTLPKELGGLSNLEILKWWDQRFADWNLKHLQPIVHGAFGPEVCGLEFKAFAADCARGIRTRGLRIGI
jgi:hypothetical protein